MSVSLLHQFLLTISSYTHWTNIFEEIFDGPCLKDVTISLHVNRSIFSIYYQSIDHAIRKISCRYAYIYICMCLNTLLQATSNFDRSLVLEVFLFWVNMKAILTSVLSYVSSWSFVFVPRAWPFISHSFTTIHHSWWFIVTWPFFVI